MSTSKSFCDSWFAVVAIDVDIALIVVRIVDLRYLDGGSVGTFVEQDGGEGTGPNDIGVHTHTDVVLPSPVHSRLIPIRKISHRDRIRSLAASSYVNVDSVVAKGAHSQATLMYVDAQPQQ